MDKGEVSRKIDADILRCRADILRSRDIMPPYKEKPHGKLQSPETDESAACPADAAEISAEKEKRPDAGTSSMLTGPAYPERAESPPKEKVASNSVTVPKFEQGMPEDSNISKVETEAAKTGKNMPAYFKKDKRQRPEIPTFDLAEEIMSEQRKITAARRKSPQKKVEVEEREFESGIGVGELSVQGPLEQDRLIAEIVAGDIERFCRDGTSELRGRDFKDAG